MLLTKNNIILIGLLVLLGFIWYIDIDEFGNIQNEFIEHNLANIIDKNRNTIQTFIKKNIKNVSIKNRINIPIYYINLDRSTERKEFMEKQFTDNKITNYYRISGVDGKNINDPNEDTIDGMHFKNPVYHLSHSELGATLAHLKAIKKAYDNGEEMALIMEDDCSLELVALWRSDLKTIINQNIPKNWGVASLFTFGCQNNEYDIDYSFADLPDCITNSACAYVINRNGMELLLNKVYDKNTNTYNIDSVADTILFDKTNTYYINIPLFIPVDDILQSTIHTQNQSYHASCINNVLLKYIKLIEKTY